MQVGEVDVARAEELFREALERHEAVRQRYSAMALEVQSGVTNDESIVEALYELGVARAVVEASRLRLKLKGGEERVVDIMSEHRRRHAGSPQMPEAINDLGTLEEAESKYLEAEIRYQEADSNLNLLGGEYQKGRIGPGDMLLVVQEMAEAQAERQIAQARVALIKASEE